MIFIEPGKLDWEDVACPVIETRLEAIVRPIVMGRCDLDVLYLKGVMPLATREPIGHEIIGEIVDLGEDAQKHFSTGEIVIVAAQISCGACAKCLRGETGKCEKVPFGASYGMGREGGYGGAVTELVKVPYAKAMMSKLPKNADYASMIGLADMATDAWRSVGPQLERCPASSVLVVGAAVPTISLYAAGLAVSLGAARVVYWDDQPERQAIARQYGAETISNFDEISDGNFDIIIDAAMDKAKLLLAMQACAPSAHITSVAPPITSPILPLIEYYHKGITWTISRPNCADAQKPTLHSWSCCGFKPELVGPKLYGFDQAHEAWLDPAPYVAVTRAPAI